MANAANRKDIRRAEKDAAIADDQRRAVIGEVMSTINGRAWIWNLLSTCSIFVTTHSPDSSIASFNEGRRSVGLELLADIMAHCPDQYIEAMREAHVRHIRDDRIPDTVAATADPASERRSGPEPDGGDFGTEPDTDTGAEAQYSSPGSDIYVNGGQAG